MYRGYVRGPEKEHEYLKWCKAKDFANAVREETFEVQSLGNQGWRGWCYGSFPSCFRGGKSFPDTKQFCDFCDYPKKLSADDSAEPLRKKPRFSPQPEQGQDKEFNIGESVTAKIRSWENEALYRPADDVVCDKKKFGGNRKRLMALMRLGMGPSDEDDTKTTWTLIHLGAGKYHILSPKKEPLYRPADDVVCDEEDWGGNAYRLLALMNPKTKVDDIKETKAVWRIVVQA